MGETTDHADVWKLHAMVYPFILDPKLWEDTHFVLAIRGERNQKKLEK